MVVLVHWGREYAAQPSDLQRAWARRLVAAGADLVVGAHPHVLQPIETIAEGGRSGVVAYSLGNFVFDQEFSPATGTGAALRFMLDRQGVALAAAAPFEIVAGQPRPLALDGDAGQAVIESLACHRDYRDREHDPKPLCDLCALCGSKANEIAAWRWDGQTATAVDVPAGTVLGARPERLPADLRGDGRQLWAALDASGMVELRDGAAADAPVVWRNEEAGWRVSRIAAGDPNDDGRIELLLLLWKPGASGVPRAHPFLVGWRGGSYRVIWGGSAPSVPIQDIAIGDLDGDGRDELVVLEGGRQRGDAAEHVAIWRWHGWSFQREWRSPAGRWAGLALQDIDGDGRVEVVAGVAGNGL